MGILRGELCVDRIDLFNFFGSEETTIPEPAPRTATRTALPERRIVEKFCAHIQSILIDGDGGVCNRDVKVCGGMRKVHRPFPLDGTWRVFRRQRTGKRIGSDNLRESVVEDRRVVVGGRVECGPRLAAGGEEAVRVVRIVDHDVNCQGRLRARRQT